MSIGSFVRHDGHAEDESMPSSPLVLDAERAPPFFPAHGDQDSYLPVEGAPEFAARLRDSSSSPVVYAELPSRDGDVP